MTDKLKPEDIERLRAVLRPRRERFDFAYTMSRWAVLVLDAEPPNDPRSERSIEGPFSWLEDGADLVTELTGKLRRGPPPPTKRGRPRVDRERHAALLLGHIFQEYAETQPTRVWDAIEDREVSRFYRFATMAFEAIGLEPSDQAFRDVCEAWEHPTKKIDFNSQAIKVQLWGGLTPRE